MMSRVQTIPPCENIILFKEVFVLEDYIALVMELPHPCLKLSEFLRQNSGHITEEMAKHLVRQLILALHHCNLCGVYHFDTHLGNILVSTDTLQLKLIDFSRAQHITATGEWAFEHN